MTLKYEQKPHITYYDDKVMVESESWYYNGGLHRDNGPASTQYRKDGTIWREEWYQHGRKHRLDGPALTFNNDYFRDQYTKSWWVHGIQYDFARWLSFSSWDDATKVEMKLIHG